MTEPLGKEAVGIATQTIEFTVMGSWMRRLAECMGTDKFGFGYVGLDKFFFGFQYIS